MTTNTKAGGTLPAVEQEVNNIERPRRQMAACRHVPDELKGTSRVGLTLSLIRYDNGGDGHTVVDCRVSSEKWKTFSRIYDDPGAAFAEIVNAGMESALVGGMMVPLGPSQMAEIRAAAEKYGVSAEAVALRLTQSIGDGKDFISFLAIDEAAMAVAGKDAPAAEQARFGSANYVLEPLDNAETGVWPEKKFRYVFNVERWDGDQRDETFNVCRLEMATPLWAAFHHACHLLCQLPVDFVRAALETMMRDIIEKAKRAAQERLDAQANRNPMIRFIIKAGLHKAFIRAAARYGLSVDRFTEQMLSESAAQQVDGRAA